MKRGCFRGDEGSGEESDMGGYKFAKGEENCGVQMGIHSQV